MIAVATSSPRRTKILDVPKSIIVPSVITLSCIGAYSLRGTMFDVLVLLIAGGLAYIFLKIDLPPVGVALGVVLGPIIEENLLVTISRAQASSLAELFLFSPLSMLFIILSALSLALPLYLEHRMKRRQPMPTRSARRDPPGKSDPLRQSVLPHHSCYLLLLHHCGGRSGKRGFRHLPLFCIRRGRILFRADPVSTAP